MKVAKKIKALPEEKKMIRPLTIVEDDGPRTILDNKQLLIGQKARLQRECDFFRKKIEQLRYELDDKENILATHKTQIQEFENVKNRLVKEILEQEERGQETLAELKHTQGLLENDLEGKRKELLDIKTNSKNELDGQSEQLLKLEVQRKELLQKIESIEHQIAGQEKALKGIQVNVDDKKLELSHLVNEIEETTGHKEAMAIEIEKLMATQQKYETKIIELSRKEAELQHEYQVETERIQHEHELERQSFEHERKMKFLSLSEKIKENEDLWDKQLRERRQKVDNDIKLSLSKAEANIAQKIKEADDLARITIEKAHREGQRIKDNAESTAQESYKERQRLYDEGSKAKLDAVQDASTILKAAHHESETLRSAAIAKMDEANAVYKDKCREAEVIVKGARAKGSLLIQNAEHERKQIIKEADIVLKEQKRKTQELEDNFSVELEKRKLSLHSYINHRKAKHEDFLKKELELFEQRMNKSRAIKDAETESIKRKEFKKIAILKNEILTNARKEVEIEKDKLKMFRKLEMEKIYNEKREAKTNIDRMKFNTDHDLSVLKSHKESELKQIERQELEKINLMKIEAEKELEDFRTQAQREIEEERREQKEFLENEIISYISKYSEEGHLSNEIALKIQDEIKEIIKDGGHKGRSEMMSKAGMEKYNGPKKGKRDFVIKYGLKMALPLICVGVFAADGFSIRTLTKDSWVKMLENRRQESALKDVQTVQETKEARLYRPQKSVGHKKTYVDNIVYTTDFVKKYEADEFQNDWLLAAYGFISNELELSEQLAIEYVSLEGAFIKEIESSTQEIDVRNPLETIEKLKMREQQAFNEIENRFGTPENWKAFLVFRDQFFSNKF